MNRLRMKAMLQGWGVVAATYFLAGALAPAGRLLSPTRLDAQVPFWPQAVWAYASFFMLVPAAFCSCPMAWLRTFTRQVAVAGIAASMIFVFWPTQVAPAPTDYWPLRWLQSLDTRANCWPSLHIALAILSAHALALGRNLACQWALAMWVALIAWSVLAVRQHQFWDIVGGAALAYLIVLATFILRKVRHEQH